MSQPLFDFDRSIGRPCKDCGYPFGRRKDSTGKYDYPLRAVDCPEHMPAHWKFHERQAYKEAHANDPA